MLDYVVCFDCVFVSNICRSEIPNLFGINKGPLRIDDVTTPKVAQRLLFKSILPLRPAPAVCRDLAMRTVVWRGLSFADSAYRSSMSSSETDSWCG